MPPVRSGAFIHRRIKTHGVPIIVAFPAVCICFVTLGNELVTVPDVHGSAHHIYKQTKRVFQVWEFIRVDDTSVRVIHSWMMDGNEIYFIVTPQYATMNPVDVLIGLSKYPFDPNQNRQALDEREQGHVLEFSKTILPCSLTDDVGEVRYHSWQQKERQTEPDGIKASEEVNRRVEKDRVKLLGTRSNPMSKRSTFSNDSLQLFEWQTLYICNFFHFKHYAERRFQAVSWTSFQNEIRVLKVYYGQNRITSNVFLIFLYNYQRFDCAQYDTWKIRSGWKRGKSRSLLGLDITPEWLNLGKFFESGTDYAIHTWNEFFHCLH